MTSDFVHRWQLGSSPRTLLLLHGTGGDENDLIPIGQLVDPAANLLSVRGRVDENGANRFFRRFAEGRFDQDNMREETAALAGFLLAASSAHSFDPGGVYAVGFSNGANMAASLLLRRPDLLAGAFLMRAMTPFEPESPPALQGKRVLLASGDWDSMVYRDDAERLASILRGGGAEVEHLWLEAGHNLTRQELEHAKQWLRSPRP